MGFNTFPCNPYPISTEELNKGNNDDLNTRVAALESDVSDLNSNKANQITIAPFFNAETAYTAGDLVYYNGLSYRCTNDHEGAWDADDFAATTIANELDSLKSGLTNFTSEISTFYRGTVPNGKFGNNTLITIPFWNPDNRQPVLYEAYIYDNAGSFTDILSSLTIVEYNKVYLNIAFAYNSNYVGKLIRVDVL